MRIASCIVTALLAMSAFAETHSLPCTMKEESGLPLPSTFSQSNDPAAFQKILSDFLTKDKYETLGWCSDKSVRDTGPYINGAYYGTHPVVRVWYSPNFAKWMLNGRKGDIPDGAMIIKEQFDTPPAGQYDGWTETQLHQYFFDHYDWTVMIRDRNGSADGWYWGEIWKGITPDSYAAPFAVFNTGFGLYCVRCHGSAESGLTFSTPNNMKGLPGQPLTFRDDLSWWPNRIQPVEPQHARKADVQESTHPHITSANMPRLAVVHPSVSVDWEKFFAGTSVHPAPHPLPGENYDHVVSPAGKPRHFLTSDQCFGCHSGNRYGNVMLTPDTRVDSKPLVNVGPYGEWRWSPMGLAGRDPIFYAQLDSEIAYLSKHRADKEKEIVNLCFSCHGAMGQRQMTLDSNGKELFNPSIVQIDDLANPKFMYGALARDGISCAVCHHIKPTLDKSLMQFIDEDATGRFQYTAADELHGPFEKPVTIPMKHSLEINPVHDSYTTNARICGTCHTIHLPVIDAADTPAHENKTQECQAEKFSFEQATYLEWLNSAYENEIDPASHHSAKSCQDCHMRGELNEAQIQTQIAVVEDNKYPATDFRGPDNELNVPIRASGYARHEFQGLNVYLLSLFDQFNEELGVRKCDYMSSGCSGKEPKSGIPFAMRNFLENAAQNTATLSLSKPALDAHGNLVVDVTITNLTGHRFPSGVSFRRAFIDFAVTDANGKVIFESGRTNTIGAIVDMNDSVLPSEYNGSQGPNGMSYQPHFWSPGNPITRSDQVQIYEELLKDADGNFTTSFLRQDCHFKDNRILPLGWRKSGPDTKKFHGKPLEETWPDLVGDDPHYADPLGAKGQSVVRYQVTLPAGTTLANVNVSAQLYYQAIPPYYLRQRFEQAPDGIGTQRLYFMTSTLDTSKTPFPGWKLLVAQTQAP
jgi:hypothetical protein